MGFLTERKDFHNNSKIGIIKSFLRISAHENSFTETSGLSSLEINVKKESLYCHMDYCGVE
ncbi:hypothetical protein GCM10011573_17860 [Enterococcus wangshanyuanii]|uniref:Uncharacterized protein n=1 Tax=Enterococcus wangshanyuanii TaxID=2005703 RepID=A0ABQ1P0U1_9ENTE|nr:hypothetical protein GCM10011573_17860 [Enterococcus wangshanyuanii]